MYTGNPSNLAPLSTIASVYPCVYREPFADTDAAYLVGGLSLCIQGTPVKTDIVEDAERFIPVYTGNPEFY